jgi:hypothetical protein
MVTKEMTAATLQEFDPGRFEKEYDKWREYAVDGGWWDYTYTQFTTDCLPKGVRVDACRFSGFYSQGDGAVFTGQVDVPMYMELQGLHETYPALFLAVVDDGSRIGVRATHRGNMESCNYNVYANQTAPSGIFENLDQQAWEELIDEQEKEADLETAVLKYCEGLAAELYKDLETEYGFLTSKEQFISSCECNEVLFDIEIDGEEDEIYS